MRVAALAALALAAGCLNYPPKPDTDAGLATCDPFSATDCPGQTCQMLPSGALACAPAGTSGDQDPCDQEPCARGYVCAVPPGGTRACLPLCTADETCPQTKGLELCTLTLPGGTSPMLCELLRPCEPLIIPVACQVGEKCSLVRIPGPFVCQPAGTRGDYEACALESDCGIGYACVSFGEAPQCVALCRADADCPQTGGLELCLGRNQPGKSPVFCERVTKCTPPLSQCSAGQACYEYRSSSQQMSYVEGICSVTGIKAEGASCDRLNDCVEGLTCVETSPGVGALCREVCTVSGTVPCPTGQGCFPMTPNFGACN